MSKERLLVIGGDAAGMSAASQARRRNSQLEIIADEIKALEWEYATAKIDNHHRTGN